MWPMKGWNLPNHSKRQYKWDLNWNNSVLVRLSGRDYMCNVSIVAACVCNNLEVRTVRMWWVADRNCGLELPGQNCSLELFWCLNCETEDCWPGLWFINTVDKLTESGDWYLSDKIMTQYKYSLIIRNILKLNSWNWRVASEMWPTCIWAEQIRETVLLW